MTVKNDPEGVYLEASVLIPALSVTAGMERLGELGKKLEIPIFMPRVSFLEWVSKSKQKTRECITAVDQRLRNLSTLFEDMVELDWPKDKEDMISDVEPLLKDRITRNGISIIETPQGINIDKMVQMAIDRKKPFKEKSGAVTGFRDCVTLFTVLKHTEARESHFSILVANDRDYRGEDVQKFAKQYGVKLEIVESIGHVNSFLEKLLDAESQEYIYQEDLALKRFLEQKTHVIRETIKRTDRPRSIIRESIEQEGYVLDCHVKNFQITIESATRGILPECFARTKKGKVNILFRVTVQFHIVAKVIPGFTDWRTRGGELYPELPLEQTNLPSSPIPTKPIERIIPWNIAIPGSVIVKRVENKNGKISDVYSSLSLSAIYEHYESL